MALTDLSRVTVTLLTLLEQALARDTNVSTIEFSAAPPDDTSSTMPNVVSVYLFHVMEDPHGRNWTPTPVPTGPGAIGQTPLGLVLHYLVTATSSVTDEGASGRTLIEQRLLGYVARAFHEVPVIDDDTTIPAVPPALSNPPLLETGNLRGADNRIQILLRPVGLDEAVNFWSAEQDRLTRVSLFYEVRVMLLETPEREGSAPPVLSVAEFVSVGGRPTLLRARSLLGFALPAGHPLADPTAPFRFIEASPARPALFPPGAAPAGVPAENARLTLEGGGLQGDRVHLSLEGPVAEGANPPAPRRFRIDLGDPGTNPDWAIAADGVRLAVDVRTTVVDTEGTTLTLYPGLYKARAVIGIQMSEQMPPRYLERSSADIAFAVVPQIESVALLGGPATARQFRITLHGAYLREELEIVLVVAGRAILRGSDPTLAGVYDLDALNPDRIDFALDMSDLSSPLPVQLLINGAEAPPAWGVV
ncbi:DUF4255 domain-containing protein [Roseospira navarrensis]|uniref:DUF4255 domain-containing protein n=1 Tax=Roseospira navarrensis TaxID=140058 RepID=A0A7X1ZGL4_9PROT|nr:DUF4255 domain-containing protein [Roseospira navarrensis]MQX37654.1 DUF4255 domain-containing protein [Roseospira navarrensis]